MSRESIVPIIPTDPCTVVTNAIDTKLALLATDKVQQPFLSPAQSLAPNPTAHNEAAPEIAPALARMEEPQEGTAHNDAPPHGPPTTTCTTSTMNHCSNNTPACATKTSMATTPSIAFTETAQLQHQHNSPMKP